MKACPSCGARRGELCITRGGNTLGVNQQHANRYRESSGERGAWRAKYDEKYRELPEEERFMPISNARKSAYARLQADGWAAGKERAA